MRHHKKPYSRELVTPTRSRATEPRTPGTAGIFSFVKNLFTPRRTQVHESAAQVPDSSEGELSMELSTTETPTIQKQTSLAGLPDFSSFATSAKKGDENDASPTSMLADFFAHKQEQNMPLSPIEIEGVMSILSKASAPSAPTTPLMSKSALSKVTALSEGQSKEVRPSTSYHPLFTPGRQRSGPQGLHSRRTIIQQSTSTPFGERKLLLEDNLPPFDPDGKRHMDTIAMPEAKRVKTKENSPRTQSKTAQSILSIIGESPPSQKDAKNPGSTAESMSPFLNPYATGVKKSPRAARKVMTPSPPARSAIEEIERTAKRPAQSMHSPHGSTPSKNLFMFPSDRMKSARTFAERYKPARSSGLKEEVKEILDNDRNAGKNGAVQSGQTPRPKFVFGTPSNSFKFGGPISHSDKAEGKPSQLGENSFGILEDADDGDEDEVSESENMEQRASKSKLANGTASKKPLTEIIDLDDDGASDANHSTDRNEQAIASPTPSGEPEQPLFVFKPPPKPSSTEFYRASESSDEEESIPQTGPSFIFKQAGDSEAKSTCEVSKNDSGLLKANRGVVGQSTRLQVLQMDKSKLPKFTFPHVHYIDYKEIGHQVLQVEHASLPTFEFKAV